jgi:Holliday junction resolvasome RuvABC endonuclease subunit
MSLTIPESTARYNILAIDPGINNTGISIFSMSLQEGRYVIKNIISSTIITNKLNNNTGLYQELHSERQIKLFKLKEELDNILVEHNPSIVICESPFYNRLTPSAYGSIVETIAMLRYSVTNFSINIPFITIEPLLIKKTIGSTLTKDKSSVLNAIKQIPNITNSINYIDSLDEHAIDSIAIGYTYILNNLNKL